VNGKQQYDEVDKHINQFCTDNNLQVKSVKEVHYLCIQLQRMANEVVTGEMSEKFDLQLNREELNKPSAKEIKVIQQVIVSGLCENVARIAPVFDAYGNEIPITSKTKVFYESQESKEKLSLHKLSSVHKERPEFVVYTDLYKLGQDDDEKCYMKNVTVIDSNKWLL
jgi:ATP-dependent RNA helicase DHX37/DHR1